MAWLRVLVRHSTHCRPYHFTNKSLIVVGRDMTSDIVLDDSVVSTCHLFLEHDGHHWRVTDRGSRNGTSTGGIPLTAERPRILPPRCWVQLGRAELEIVAHSPPRRPPGYTAERFEVALARLHEDERLGVICVEGPRASEITEIVARPRPYRMGPTRLSEIRLDDTGDDGAEPVQLMVSDSGVRVMNLAGVLPVRVGHWAVGPGMTATWYPQEMIRVGGSVFALSQRTLDALDELKASELANATQVPE